MIVATILMPFVLFAGCLGLVIGPELVLLAVLTEVSAEPCPPGRWTVVQLGADDEEDQGLRHSSAYQSPKAVEAVLALLTEMDRRALIKSSEAR